MGNTKTHLFGQVKKSDVTRDDSQRRVLAEHGVMLNGTIFSEKHWTRPRLFGLKAARCAENLRQVCYTKELEQNL